MGMKNKNIEDFYPLSPMQQGIFFHSIAAPESAVYFEQFSWTIQGKLNITMFHRAWQYIVERHSLLRTCFVWKGLKEPVQIVRRLITLPWVLHDLRHLSPVEQQQWLEAFLQSDRDQGFELTRPPLMRLTLIHLLENSYHFTWSHHHLLLDGWSVAIIYKEVFDCYKAFSNGQDINLEPMRSYRDYIVWLQQQNLSLAETFWRQLLKGFTAPTRLWVDGIGQLSSSIDGYNQQQITLGTQKTAALQRMAQQHQLTLNTLIQGAWALLLSRYTSQKDVVFGATTSGRPPALSKAESMVGLFINTLPVRVQVSPEQFVLSWLKQIQTQQIETRQYEYSPLVEIQGWSEVPRGIPLFESIVVFENYPIDVSLRKLDLNLEIKRFSVFEKTNYPLTLCVIPGEELLLKMTYNDSERFDSNAIKQMLEHLKTLLEGIVTNPQQRLSDLPMLTETERNQLLVEWNNTQADYPQHQCIHQLFEAQVELTPDAVAVVFENQQLTYCELNARANQLAHHLQKLGVKPEVLVGICTERSLYMVIGLLGILKAGGAYIPLDPRYPQERLAFILEDALVPVLLTQQGQVEGMSQHKAKVICLDATWQAIAKESKDNLVCEVTTNNLAYVIYTSGSTGRPKGVMIKHCSTVALLDWAKKIFAVEARKAVLASTSICFDLSIFEIFVPLGCGGKVILIDNALYLPTLPAAQSVTLINTVPTVIAELLKTDSIPASVYTVNIAGEPLQSKLVEQLYQRDNIQQVFNLYGPSEDTTYSTFARIEKRANIIPPIGRPINNTQIYLLDEYLQPVPIGVPGEIYIGGDGLARGYLNRPELTAEKFLPNSFSEESAACMYKTGDLARYLPNGDIKYLGRIDNQVKVRGFRIELGEIEAVVHQHPAVRESVVVMQEDELGSKHLVAYIVFQSNQTLKITEMRRFLESKLPNYMMPTAFVTLDVLPLLPNGKVDRSSLPTPSDLRQNLEVDYVMPQTEVEQTIATVWQKVLKVENIGIYDNFFEIGGNSLLIVKIHSQLCEAFTTNLSIVEMFKLPTISSLTYYLSQEKSEKAHLNTTIDEVKIEKNIFQQLLSKNNEASSIGKD